VKKTGWESKIDGEKYDISTFSSIPPVGVQYWLSNGQTNRCVHGHNTDATSTADKIAALLYVTKYGWVGQTALSISSINNWQNNKM
jgi:hypothetical protein